MLALAGGYAVAEAGAGLALAAFSGHGRADWLPFVAVRPWLILLLFVIVAGWRWQGRIVIAVLGLAAATIGEGGWIAWLGGDIRIAPIVLAAGLALAAIFELVLWFQRWSTGGRRWLAAAIMAGLLLLPGAVAGFERLSLAAGDPPSRSDRPDLPLLSGLPITWSEGGVAQSLAGEGHAAAMASLLSRYFSVRPIATADEAGLDRSKLLLVIQPHIDAAGLVALDGRVRAGGAVLILADPDLRWPTRFSPDDPRHPPGAAILGPLLAHWGLSLDADPVAGAAVRQVRWNGALFRVRPGAPGRWRSTGGHCVLSANSLVADCVIGRGRAVLIADADLLLDDLWVGMGSHGTDRYRRTADNGPLLVTLLDGLGRAHRPKTTDSVAWIGPESSMGMGTTILLLPGVALILVAGIYGRRLRKTSFHG